MATADIDVSEKVDQATEIKLPKMYKVILHNDNTTTMDFVIMVLVKIFHRTTEESMELTQVIHETGQGVAGAPYTREIAEEKTLETLTAARANNFPLMATFEEI